MKTLTIDTNVLRDAVEPHRAGYAIAKELLALHEAGKCEIRVTTRLDVDVPREPLRSIIDSLEVLDAQPIGTLFTIGYSALDGGDTIASDELAHEADELMDLLFPGADENSPRHKNRIADVGHLMGQKLSGRDVFVTNENAILDRRKELRRRFGIAVMSSRDALSSIAK